MRTVIQKCSGKNGEYAVELKIFCLVGLFFLPVLAQAAANIPECTRQNAAVSITAAQPMFTVRLVSNPSTGYRWFLLDKLPEANPLSVEFVPATGGLVGAPGM